MAKKTVLVCTLGLFASLFLIKVSLATSGECSYHSGVNCNAGPNSQGYAVCNDGWTSSVPYSQTDECQSSCVAPADVASEVQTIQQDANQIIQIIKNGYAPILSEDTNLCQNEEAANRGSAAARGLLGSPAGASMLSQAASQCATQYALDQSKEQLAISQEQMKADAQKQQIENEQCAAPATPICPTGATFDGTSCVCGAGRVLWNNSICTTQAFFESLQCGKNFGPNYDYSTSTNRENLQVQPLKRVLGEFF